MCCKRRILNPVRHLVALNSHYLQCQVSNVTMCVCCVVDMHHRDEENPYFTFLSHALQLSRRRMFLEISTLWCHKLQGYPSLDINENSWQRLIKQAQSSVCGLGLQRCSTGEKAKKKEVITTRGPLKVRAWVRYEQTEATATAVQASKVPALFFGRLHPHSCVSCVRSSNKRTVKCNTCRLLKREREKR